MKHFYRFALVAILALAPAVFLKSISEAQAQAIPVLTTEVLVTITTPVLMPALPGRKAIEIQNLGSFPIYCALTSASKAVATKARRVDANGGTWALDLPSSTPMYCVAGTSNQVTGAATIVTEL